MSAQPLRAQRPSPPCRPRRPCRTTSSTLKSTPTRTTSTGAARAQRPATAFGSCPEPPCVRAIRRRARAQARHPAQAYREDDDQGPSAARDGVARPRRHAESRLGSLRDPQVRTRARARGSATVACLALIPLARRASGRSLTSSSSAGQTTQTPSPASLLEASASTRPARSSTDDRRPSSPVSLPPPRPDT